MIHTRRGVVLVAAAILVSLMVYLRAASSSITMRTLRSKVPQVIGLGDYFESEEQYAQDRMQTFSGSNRTGASDPGPAATSPQSFSTVTPSARPAGANCTRNLVMARMKEDNVDWLDQVDLGSPITKMMYVADDPNAALHPPKNKGHEVMTYLTYILDYYDDLPDLTLFMHSHQFAWHNNELLNSDSGEMIKRLSSERVQRQGYMNMRCHWAPGCPDWIRPGQMEEDRNKLEQSLMATAWAELFPDNPIPDVLAQPCCSQFAVSRDTIRSTPREKYFHYREWLLRSEIRDTMSGRIFEYVWQAIFLKENVVCPDQRACYCDGYGVCFESEATWEKWFELQYEKRMAERDLRAWNEKAEAIEKFRAEGRLEGIEAGELEVPEIGKNEELEAIIHDRGVELEDRRLDALQRGTDPRVRAESAGRPWKEGDGY